MQIDEEELRRRLNSSKNISNILGDSCSNVEQLPEEPVRIVDIEKRVPPVTPSVPDRILAGVMACKNTPKEVSKALDMTISQVVTAKYTKKSEIAVPREKAINQVQELALDKMINALNIMSEERLENASLKDLSNVAANMARIIEKTSTKEVDSRVQLVIYAPQERAEEKYKVIDV